MGLSIVLLAIVCIIQTLRIHFLEKDSHSLKRHVVALYAIFDEKFDITVSEIIENCERYAEENKDFIR